MSALAADGVAIMLLISVAVYSVAGGTDYGAGIWDLLAGGPQGGAHVRRLIDHAMAPVWEANNVWLAFAAVLAWTGFPLLFQSAFASLYPLFTVALLGLILRGAFFAFRKISSTPGSHRAASIVFGVSSVLAPFCFAAVLGAIASGRIGVGGPVVPVWQACLNPTSVMFGLVALAATAFSGASFLTGDARRYGTGDLVGYFRWRAIVAGVATLVVGAGALAVMHVDTPAVFDGMVAGRGLPFAAVAVAATLAVIVLLWRRQFHWFRVLTVAGVGAFVFAWGFGQSPYLLPGRLTIAQGAGAPSTQVFVLVVSVVAIVLVTPSLALLYALDQRNDLTPEE